MTHDAHAAALAYAQATDVTVALVPTPPGSPAPLWLTALHTVGGLRVRGRDAIATALELEGDGGEPVDLGELSEALALRAAIAGHRDAWHALNF